MWRVNIHCGGVLVCSGALCCATGISYHDYSLGFVALLLSVFGGYLWGLDATITVKIKV